MNTFFDAFWPNLASTLIGIVLGLPLGLRINRKSVAQTEGVRRAGERLRVAHALKVLDKALTENRTRLDAFAAVLVQNQTLYDTAIDNSAWDAVKADLTTELSDPELRQRFAYHFARLATLVKLNDDYLSFLVGVGASMSSALATQASLAKVISALVTELQAEAQSLAVLATTERTRLAA